MNTITKATVVSDGVVIEFGDGVICYFPANSLHEKRLDLNGQILVTENSPIRDTATKREENRSEERALVSSSDHVLHQ